MNNAKLKKLKAHYEKIRSDIVNSLSNIDEETDLEGDEIDRIQGNALLRMSQKLYMNRKVNLSKIEEGLRAISDGTINECEECGEPIGEKRLIAIPGVRVCVRCAEEIERNSKNFA